MSSVIELLIQVFSSQFFCGIVCISCLLVMLFSSRSLCKKKKPVPLEKTFRREIGLSGHELNGLIKELLEFRDSLIQERKLARYMPERLERRLAVLVSIEEQLFVRSDVTDGESWKEPKNTNLEWVLPYCHRKIEALKQMLAPTDDEASSQVD